MKPLERIFFQACIMRVLLSDTHRVTVWDIVNIFSVLGFSRKRLWYYIRKWDRLGFYDYGVTEALGWFDPDKFIGEYKVMYEKILKERENGTMRNR